MFILCNLKIDYKQARFEPAAHVKFEIVLRTIFFARNEYTVS